MTTPMSTLTCPACEGKITVKLEAVAFAKMIECKCDYIARPPKSAVKHTKAILDDFNENIKPNLKEFAKVAKAGDPLPRTKKPIK